MKIRENGFELWADVVTRMWIVTDTLVKVRDDNGSFVPDPLCPFAFQAAA